MKTNKAIIAAAFLGPLIPITSPSALAEPPVTEVTRVISTQGTISEFGPERIVVRTETEKTPIGYSFTKTTTYVDEDGRPVAVETVKSGAPVTVYYTREGDHLIASKVVVRRTHTPGGVVEERITKTPVPTTAGTISEFGRDGFVITSESSPEPLRYRYTKTTTYVDEDGRPVSIETVKSGVPVTVYYTRDGDGMNATKVIVRKAPPGAVIIHKKTTTVTEEKK